MKAIMSDKKFKLPAEQIKPIATGSGACYASDRITVDRERVGDMYRVVCVPKSGR